MHKNLLYFAATLLVTCVVSSTRANNGTSTKPVIFQSAPPTTPATNSSDNGKSESRVNENIVPEGSQGSVKPPVSSNGYQLEVINDDTEEAQEQAGSENPKPLRGLYPPGVVGHSAGRRNQFLHAPDYDENSAREDVKDEYTKGKVSFGEISPKSDISRVRDIFVGKEVGSASHLPSPSSNPSYPASAPLESKYKLEYESPIKYINSPILLKQSSSPLVEPSPVAPPVPLESHPHGLLETEVTGHTAGYGHGYHHHQQKLKSKPLKPSVVYRDPSDRFDHRDKLRTLDKDHLGGAEKDSRHPYGPHVVGKEHDFHDYHHEKKGTYEPSHYDQNKIPECAHKNKYIYNVTFCLDDPHYPTEAVIWALKKAGHDASKLLADVTYQSADNLVSGLTRAEEEGYTYKHYFGASHSQNSHLDKYKPPYQGYTYSTDYFKKGGYLCPSSIFYARVKRAQNSHFKWKVIVNVPEHIYEKFAHGSGHGHHEGGHFNKGHGHVPDHGYHVKGHGHNEGHFTKGHHVHDEHYGKGHGHDEHHGKGHGHDEHNGKPHGHDEHYGKPHGHDGGYYEKDHGHAGHDVHYGKPHGHDGGYYGKDHGHEGHHGYEADSYGPEHHHSIKKREYKEKKSYTQTLRLEQCIYPNAPCSYVDSHYHSRCIQKHNFVKLLAWSHEDGLHIDVFKLPIACSCHVRQPIHFYHESGHHGHKHGHVVPPVSSYHGPPHPHHAEPQHHDGLKKVY